ncbi:hypothetical protein DFH27DRAFT_615896 [Peziza echinospora]|nr:hypothetical protein DFH27DRAFT_615896 [Peziza echinospora]
MAAHVFSTRHQLEHKYLQSSRHEGDLLSIYDHYLRLQNPQSRVPTTTSRHVHSVTESTTYTSHSHTHSRTKSNHVTKKSTNVNYAANYTFSTVLLLILLLILLVFCKHGLSIPMVLVVLAAHHNLDNGFAAALMLVGLVAVFDIGHAVTTGVVASLVVAASGQYTSTSYLSII